MTDALRRHGAQDLPRYTSYPTAVKFTPQVSEAEARAWAGATTPDQALSVYLHTPFCDQLCWYCGCHTSVPNGYDRVAAFVRTARREATLWSEALGPHAGATHLHFGGGSPNALSPGDFLTLLNDLRRLFRARDDAEIAVELDPRTTTKAFLAALGDGGVTRASLGVQSFDPVVQAKVNRIQPLDMVAQTVADLRARGVGGINFDLMYGLPGQDVASVRESVRDAAALRPDRVAVFGYAHVPWFKKHQRLIRDEDLAGPDDRWEQAGAAEEELIAAGYRPIGLDHYALDTDSMAQAAEAGRLRRNFQGYTTDPAPVLVPLGPSSIGSFPQGFVQNHKPSNLWAQAVEAGRLAVERGLALTDDDRLRARAIEQVMCALTIDLEAVCAERHAPSDALDHALPVLRDLAADGLCRVSGRNIKVTPQGRRLVRAVAAAFDADRQQTQRRHSLAV